MTRIEWRTDMFSQANLFRAYRKAKAEAFFNKTHFNSLAFAKFEQRLQRNIERLQERLTEPRASWVQDENFIGGFSHLPKSIVLPDLPAARAVEFATLDPLRDWYRECKQRGGKAKATFRQIMTPTVDFQIVAALWVMEAGYTFDSALDRTLAFAHELRRVGRTGPIAEDSNALFVPYMNGYRRWRTRGLEAMKRALSAKRDIAAVTMDVRQFYHRVSPAFLLKPGFHRALGVSLSPGQADFSKEFVQAIQHWYSLTPDARSRPEGGLPVGLSASRLISNVLLAEFDRAAFSQLNAIYYGRYADDIFLVVERPVRVETGEEFIRWVRQRLDKWLVLDQGSGGSGLRLKLPYAQDCEIVFANDKQKIFFVGGDHGLDLVDQIVEKVKQQSSDFKRMPELPKTETEMVAKALLASPDATLEADALRKAEAVSIRRLGFSRLLSDIEAYAENVAPEEWRHIRSKFYGLVERYVLTPAGLFDYFTYIVRVFGLAVACRDFASAERFLLRFSVVCTAIRRTSNAGSKLETRKFENAIAHYKRGFLQAAIEAASARNFRFQAGYRRLVSKLSRRQVTTTSASETALALLRADLGRRPYFEYWFEDNVVEQSQPPIPKDRSVRKVLVLTRRFRTKSGNRLRVPHWPAIAFPTRPIPISRICLIAPELLEEPGGLEDVILATRGARVRPELAGFSFVRLQQDAPIIVDVPHKNGSKRRIAVPSFENDLEHFNAAAAGKPNLSLDRFVSVSRLLNRVMKQSPNIQYFPLPECALPLRWALFFAEKLGKLGIGFICGVESTGVGKIYTNEAVISLPTTYFGGNASIAFRQPKLRLSHGESDLCKLLGKVFNVPSGLLGRPVFVHGGFCFAVSICSDFTSIENRAFFQGHVDALFVLEWNKDVNTFEFLVEAGAHDLHAAIVQINNRKYGDSRIRVPYFDNWDRDVVRVKGGVDDFYVEAEVDFAPLRAFQRGHGHKKDFKPLPIGFKMSKLRRDSNSF